jgi:RND superfamily putative drug exporter
MVFERIGRFSFRYRWFVLAIWLVVVLAVLPTLPRVTGRLEVGGFSSPHTEAARTRELLRERIPGYSPSSLLVLFSHPTLSPFDPVFVEQAQRALSTVPSIPYVTGIRWFTENPAKSRRMVHSPTRSSKWTCNRKKHSGSSTRFKKRSPEPISRSN